MGYRVFFFACRSGRDRTRKITSYDGLKIAILHCLLFRAFSIVCRRLCFRRRVRRTRDDGQLFRSTGDDRRCLGFRAKYKREKINSARTDFRTGCCCSSDVSMWNRRASIKGRTIGAFDDVRRIPSSYLWVFTYTLDQRFLNFFVCGAFMFLKKKKSGSPKIRNVYLRQQ